MARVLQPPQVTSHNVRIYHNDGTLLACEQWKNSHRNQTDLQRYANAAFEVEPRQRYLTWDMLYRYCTMIFILPNENQWALFPLSGPNEHIGNAISQDSRRRVSPGNYLVLGFQNKAEIAVELIAENAPRRVLTQDNSPDSRSQGRTKGDRLQSDFRARLIGRDGMCAISNRIPAVASPTNPFLGLVAAHVFPVSQRLQWDRDYKRSVDDTGSATSIGQSGLYSSQNGLLLIGEMHTMFDNYLVGVDPDAGYKIIPFGTDNTGIGGTRLKDSARYGTRVPAGASANSVSPGLLRWHLRMCVYANMKANAEPQEYWERDLGDDNMGRILEQPDAAERMEVELFTRLGGLIS